MSEKLTPSQVFNAEKKDIKDLFSSQEPSKLGKYKILEKIGSGGMGVVYKAQDSSLKRLVAIKVIKNDYNAEKEEHKKRFYREARLMSKLKHPGIVAIHDIEQQQKQLFIVMEFITGENLQSLLTQKISIPQLLKILQKIASIIHYAHQQGIIHRDLKPHNVMLVEYEPKVMDFGLAKELEDSENLSKSNAAIGTLAYMSPEQVRGELREIDIQSDVYSLGVILYQMLTGKLPFAEQAVAYKILHQEPKPPSYFYPLLAKDLEAIVSQC